MNSPLLSALILFTIGLWFIPGVSSAQTTGVSINTSGTVADPSASLDISGTQQGVLINRLTTAERDGIVNPAEGLLIFNTITKCFEFYALDAWQTGSCAQCPPVPAPGSASHIANESSITWNWDAVSGVLGYKCHFLDNFNQASDAGQSLSFFQDDLTCGISYTLYVWAYSACGYSLPLVLTAGTTNCPSVCSGTFTDSRDSKEYGMVLIGDQCWMSQGLNFGTRINTSVTQTNNSVAEKYCYTNDEANCTTYGGLYQWGEVVQYLNGASNTTNWNPQPSGHVQGICPPGWHVPTETEVLAMATVLGGASGAGGKMKATGFTHWDSPNTGADNSSGFNSLGAGNISSGTSTQQRINNPFWTASMASNQSTSGARFHMTTYTSAQLLSGDGGKTYGYMVRCVKD